MRLLFIGNTDGGCWLMDATHWEFGEKPEMAWNKRPSGYPWGELSDGPYAKWDDLIECG